MTTMDVRGAIFDLDGTLIDSMGVWDRAWETFCDRYAPVREESAYSKYKTLTLVTACEFYKEHFKIPAPVPALCDEVNAIVREGYKTVEPKPGVREFLEKLRSRGVPVCVATNTARPLVEFVLSRLGLSGYFRFILPCAEFGSGKDRPEIFLECANRLGTPPGETWVFEDAPHALRTAHDAGFRTCAIRDPSYAAAEPELRALADRYAESFSAI